MHRVGWVLVAVLGGCTALNGAFEDGRDSAATGGTTNAETSPATTSTTGARPTASGSGVTSVGDASTYAPPATSGGPQTGSTSASGTSQGLSSSGDTTGRISETGNADSATGSDSRVVFIYAANNWMDEGNMAPGSNATNHCSDFAPPAASLCDTAAVALLHQPPLTVPNIIEGLDPGWLGLPVFGIESDGENPLANSPLDLLGGLETSLALGGVEDPSNTGEFYSGGALPGQDTCGGWTNTESMGVIGAFDDSTNSWFSSVSAECSEPRPILCACRSGPDPFS